MNLNMWAIKWGVSYEAIEDLKRQFGTIETESIQAVAGNSETAVQNHIRLEASKRGWRLWRNNVGVLTDKRGVPVRYGLCNDSPAMNKVLKSSDLIGIGEGGQFIAREVKRKGWSYSGTPHEEAQLNFIELVNAMGGDAKFTTGDL